MDFLSGAKAQAMAAASFIREGPGLGIPEPAFCVLVLPRKPNFFPRVAADIITTTTIALDLRRLVGVWIHYIR
jgi:hypothetical protein